MSLFRAEIEEERSRAWLGRIVLIRPVAFGVLTVAALGITMALAAFFALGEYTRKARVTGTLAPSLGIAKVVAQQSGRVEALFIREGARIARDEALMVVVDGRASLSQSDMAAEVSARIDDRERALLRQHDFLLAAMETEQAAIAEKLTNLRREAEAADDEIATLDRRGRLAASALERSERLHAIGFVSAAALDRERDAGLEHRQRVEAARRARLAMDREISALVSERESARARSRAQAAGVSSQRASVSQERLERDFALRAAIVAPVDGTLAALPVEEGQMVTAGTALAAIIPSGSVLEAHLFAPSRAIGFVRPGQQVTLRYLAFPHQKFGSQPATVVAISRSPLQPAELGYVPPDGAREPLYRIKVALDTQSIVAYGRPEPLQPGMQVEADLLLDKRRLIEWVFEPLLSLSGRV